MLATTIHHDAVTLKMIATMIHHDAATLKMLAFTMMLSLSKCFFQGMMRCSNTLGTPWEIHDLIETQMEGPLARVTTSPIELGVSQMDGPYENPDVFHKQPPFRVCLERVTTSPTELATCPNDVPLDHDSPTKFPFWMGNPHAHAPWTTPCLPPSWQYQSMDFSKYSLSRFTMTSIHHDAP